MMQQATLDKDAFCAEILLCREAMFRTARSILKNNEDVEDAVQEAICTAFASRSQLRDRERFRPWLLRILTNKCYDLCRRKRPTVDLADVEPILAAPERDVDQSMTLWQAVLSLDEDLRATVTLFYYEDLPIREISAILDVSEAAVKTRLSRARKKLRLLLEQN